MNVLGFDCKILGSRHMHAYCCISCYSKYCYEAQKSRIGLSSVQALLWAVFP